jgi:GH24 family phage-related lysozyme (muramidase)
MTLTATTVLDARIPLRLAQDVDASEKDELTAYPDSLGNWTIGRGHLMPKAAPGRSWAGFTIIQSTSDRYFNDDLLSAITFAEKLPEFPKCDTDARKNALYELCFNMRGKWEEFTHARAALMAQDWRGIAAELLDSRWARQVGIGHYTDGKPKRATRIANQFLIGEYDEPKSAA